MNKELVEIADNLIEFFTEGIIHTEDEKDREFYRKIIRELEECKTVSNVEIVIPYINNLFRSIANSYSVYMDSFGYGPFSA